jgi:3-oxoacyl-[acyl-carrier-protein] synthase-1
VVVNGFDALEVVSTGLATPMGEDRRGINLGEGAALFVMEKNRGEIALLGVGESSDAHHLTAPDPEGRGA